MAAFWRLHRKSLLQTAFRISVPSVCLLAALSEPTTSTSTLFSKNLLYTSKSYVNCESGHSSGDAINTEKKEEKKRIIGRSQDSDWVEGVTEQGYLYESNVNTSETRWKTPYKWRKNWDYREEKPSKSHVIHQIVLVRHGQYTSEHASDGSSSKGMFFFYNNFFYFD